MIMGASTMSGWLLGIPWLTDWPNVGVSMFFNTGLGLVLSGAALWQRNGPHISGARLCAAVAGCIGAATACEHLFEVDLGIDELFVTADWGQRGANAPSRMGPPASIMFMIINAALILSTFGRAWRTPAVVGAGLCIGISSLSVLGYLFQAHHFYLLPTISTIALNTSICFMLLGLGLMAGLPEEDPIRTLLEMSATGAMVRRALPVLVLLPIVFSMLRELGEMAGYYDPRFGAVLRTVFEIVLLLVVLWWLAQAVREHERLRRESEQAVHASEQRYQAFIRNSSEGIWRCELAQPMPIDLPENAALDWVYAHAYMAECNDAMAGIYGFTQGSELVGARFGDLVPRNPENEAYLRAFMAGGYALQAGESEERDKQGNTLYFSNNLVGIVEDGLFLRAWGTQVDITEQKRVERSLIETDRRKDEFLATLAHELRNPLAPINNGLELLAEDADPEKATVYAMMKRQMRQLIRLVDDLLDVSRISHGKIVLRKAVVELAPLIHQAAESIRPQMESAQQVFNISLPSAPLHVHGDGTRLVQAIGNLLNNASKFTPSHGSIALTLSAEEGHACIHVRDTGIGLEPDEKGKIFELFGQADTSLERNTSGLGIGLSLTKNLAEMHGGSVDVVSEGRNKGCTFTLRIPLCEVPEERTLPSQRPLAKVPKHTLLIVDDNVDGATSLAMLMKAQGHVVHEAHDGAQALAVAAAVRPGIVLLDIGMPNMNGYEVARRLRSEAWGPGMVLIALTGWGQDEDKRRSQEAGFDHHLVKPPVLGDINRILASVQVFESVGPSP